MKIVAVTSCPSGIAHTYMAAEAIKNICKKKGYSVKVEMQGQMGPENVLTGQEIKDAEAIVLANGVSLVNPERFQGYEDKTIHISVDTALRKPEQVINAVKEAGLLKD